MTDEEARKLALDYNYGVFDGVAPLDAKLLNTPIEERRKKRKYAVMDENFHVYEPSEDRVASAFTSTLADDFQPMLAGAAGAATATAALGASGVLPVVAAAYPPAAPLTVPAVSIAAPLVGAIGGSMLGAMNRDKGKPLLQVQREEAQRQYFKDNNWAQYYGAKLLGQFGAFKLPSKDLFTGIASRLTKKAVTPEQAAALAAAKTGAIVSTGVEAGGQIANQDADLTALALAPILGGSSGPMRAIPHGLGTTLGKGMGNIVNKVTGRPTVQIREDLPANHPALFRGSMLGEFAQSDPATAKTVMHMKAIERDYAGLGNAALRDLTDTKAFNAKFPDVDHKTTLASAGQKRRAAYDKGYTEPLRSELEAVNALKNAEKEFAADLAKGPSNTAEYKNAVKLMPIVKKQLVSAETSIAQLVLYSKQNNIPLHYDPGYTPAEAAAIDSFVKFLKETSLVVRARGAGTIAGENPNYTPLAINTDHLKRITALSDPGLRKFEITKLIDKLTGPEQEAFVRSRGQLWDREDAQTHFQGLLTEIMGQGLDKVGHAKRSDPHDFAGLYRDERIYSPLFLAHENPVKQLELYKAKFAPAQAIAETIGQSTHASANLGFETTRSGDKSQIASEEGRLLKDAITGAKSNSDAGEVLSAAQRFGNTINMQAGTGVDNYLAGFVKSLRDVVGPKTLAAVLRGNVKAWSEFANLKNQAMQRGVVAANNDEFQYVQDASLAEGVASGARRFSEALNNASNTGQRWSFSNMLEALGRVRDFAVGKELGALHEKILAKDPLDTVSAEWLLRNEAGVPRFAPEGERLERQAANYVVSQQSAYDFTGLPQLLAKRPENFLVGTAQFATRLNRYGVDTTLRMYNDVIGPAERGDARPLIALIAGTIAGKPVFQEWHNATRDNQTKDDDLREQEIQEGTPENMKGVYQALLLIESLDAMQQSGALGSILSTAAKRAQGKNFDYFGSPSLTVPKIVWDGIQSIATSVEKGTDPVEAALRVMEDAVVQNVQNIRMASTFTQPLEDRLHKFDIQNKREWENRNAPNQGITTMLKRASPGGIPNNKYQAPLHQFTDRLQGKSAADLELMMYSLDPERGKMELKDALLYGGTFRDPKKRAAYEGYLLRVRGPEYLEQVRARAQSLRNTVIENLESVPARQP